MTYRLYEVQNHPKTIGSLAYSWGVSAFTDTSDCLYGYWTAQWLCF